MVAEVLYENHRAHRLFKGLRNEVQCLFAYPTQIMICNENCLSGAMSEQACVHA